MIAAESSTREFEKLLVQYLLSTAPACLTIIGRPVQADQWAPVATGEMPRILQFDTFSDCHAAMETAPDESSAGASIALLQLDGDDHDCQKDGALVMELGKAVRRFPDRLVVSIDSPEPADTQFFAFGFRKLQLAQQGSIRLFEYCLSEYKQPPDWLNARYWANPDRFGNDEDPDIYSDDYNDDEE